VIHHHSHPLTENQQEVSFFSWDYHARLDYLSDSMPDLFHADQVVVGAGEQLPQHLWQARQKLPSFAMRYGHP
jgi:cytochrome c-type biogenesis protein CcmE